MAAKLSETMSWHVGMAYNVIIFNLAESHDFKQHGSNLMNYVRRIILNRKMSVTFSRLGQKNIVVLYSTTTSQC